MDCLDLESKVGAGFQLMDLGAKYGQSCFCDNTHFCYMGFSRYLEWDGWKAGGVIETVPRSFGSRLCKGTHVWHGPFVANFLVFSTIKLYCCEKIA